MSNWRKASQIGCTAPTRSRIANPLDASDPTHRPAGIDAMASNLDTLVTVFGGSGFLGRNVVRALCKR
ncbi:MAG: hypothetical protein E6G70_05160, partial [Alphaproteobacteria bacterium]